MILRVRDNDGNILEIPAIKGDSGQDGITPERGIDYYTDKDKQDLIEEIKEGIGNVYVFKGSVDTFDNLPTADMNDETAGYVYNVTDTGVNYAWVAGEDSGWDALGMIYDVTDVVSSESDALVTSSGVAKSLKNIDFSDINGLPFGINYINDTGVVPYEYPENERVKVYTNYGDPFITSPYIVTVQIMNDDTILYSEECKVTGNTISIYNRNVSLTVESTLDTPPSSMGDFPGAWGIYVTCTDRSYSLGANKIRIMAGIVSELPNYYLPKNIPTREDVQAMIDTSIGEYDEALLEIIGE